jgi:hypothetical protein
MDTDVTHRWGQADKLVHGFAFRVAPLAFGTKKQSERGTDVLSAYRELRNHRQHAHRCAGGHERFDRLVLLPYFDSPSFGAILDDNKEAASRFAPPVSRRHKQFYWPSTNILVTRFLLPDGIAELEDFMPVGLAADSPGITISIAVFAACAARCAFRCLPPRL